MIKNKLEFLLSDLGFVSTIDANKLYHTGFLNKYPCEAYLVKPDTIFKSYALRVIISFLPNMDYNTFAREMENMKKNLFREKGTVYRMYLHENTLILEWRFYKEPITTKQLTDSVNIQTIWLENQGLAACSHTEANTYGDKLAEVLYA